VGGKASLASYSFPTLARCLYRLCMLRMQSRGCLARAKRRPLHFVPHGLAECYLSREARGAHGYPPSLRPEPSPQSRRHHMRLLSQYRLVLHYRLD
jgi:hypothetical protein